MTATSAPSPKRLFVTALLSILAVPMAACNRSATASNDTIAPTTGVRDALQTYFRSHPQCAPILQTDARTNDLVAQPGDAAARALLSAGVIEQAAPGTIIVGGEKVVRYRPAERYRSSFAKANWGPSEGWILCYAHRAVEDVSIKSTPAGYRAEYRFTLIDSPPWMRDPAIVAGFPAVVASLSGRFEGEEPVPVENGKPDLDSLQPTFEHSLVTRGAAFLTR